MIAPNTDIYLIKTPIEIDETNQLTFNNVHEQAHYFLNLPKLYLDNATYQRKDNVIRYPNTDVTYDELLKYNYCAYRNDSYSDRIFYAFIKNMRYVNDGMTEIEIETDVFQTWQFEIQYRSSFIEREHVSDDTIGKHTIPEGLETGEIIMTGIDRYAPLQATVPVMGCTEDIATKETVYPWYLNGKLRSVNYYIFTENSSQTPYTNTGQQSEAIMQALAALKGEQDAIVTIFMAPVELVNWQPYNSDSTEGWTGIPKPGSILMDHSYRRVCWNKDYNNPISMSDFNFNRQTSFGSYVPKNNKLKVFPYCYMMMTNNNGGNAIYHYEDFSYSAQYPNRITFEVKGVVCPGCSIRCMPKNYKGIEHNYTTGISAGKFPICDYVNDIFVNWLTQNGVNYALSTVGNVGMAAAGIVSAIGGNPLGLGMAAGGAAGVINDMKEIYQKSFTPPQAEGDLGSAEISYSCKENTFEAHHYRIKEEYAKIIDEFFSTYGYKVNEVKIPNIKSRRNWNYIKTIDSNLTGEIPQEDLQKLKQIFNNGCTFWHNPNTFLDYSQPNNIL